MAMLSDCWKSDEHREAVAAFREKRPPVFRPEE
jgi:enoyl-CoA hydratase/carnithine racemase